MPTLLCFLLAMAFSHLASVSNLLAQEKGPTVENDEAKSQLLSGRNGKRWIVRLSSSGPTRIPRVYASLKASYFQGMPDKPVIVHPEIEYWEIRFEGPALAKNVALEFDSYPATLAEAKPTTQAGDSTITLRCGQGRTKGEKLRFEPQPHKNTIGYWAVQTDTVSWPMEISKAGVFNVGMLIGAGEKGGGKARVSLLSDNQVLDSFEFDVEVTGHFQNFVWKHVGELKIEKPGQYSLKIEATEIDNVALMDVRQVHLSPRPIPMK